jgi:hypothetical protein
MTIRTRPVDRRLWLVSLALIVGIVAIGYILAGPTHAGSPVVVRLIAAAIVTACAAVAKVVAGPRAAAATAVVGVLIWVVLASQIVT